jgi:2-oxo-3-hexenedioate decarboxylase/2-keto-4-pentenoate hydratase
VVRGGAAIASAKTELGSKAVPNVFDATRAAEFIASAHANRSTYVNLPADIGPTTVDEAYAAQEALRELWAPILGPLAGLKIATTTKVMQQLMGIDHPCGGMIYASRVHTSPATIRHADFVHVVVECELAVRIGRDLLPSSTPFTRESVRDAVSEVMASFELIEDRNADYKQTSALSLIADNAWNGGIVLGSAIAPPPGDLNGITGRLSIDGKEAHTGRTDDPMGALAWIANLAAQRNRPMTKGMVVITGSVIATLPIAQGQNFTFSLDGIGSVTMTGA